MQINVLCNPPGTIPWLRRGLTTKTMLVMKLTAIIILAATLHLTAGVTAQKVTYTGKSVPLQQLFAVIEQQTGYVFFYDKHDLSGTRSVSVNFKDADLTSALREVLKEQPLGFYLENSTVFIVKKVPAAKPAEPSNTIAEALVPPILIKGRVVDDKSGEPLADVSILVKGSTIATNTNRDGEFQLTVPSGINAELVITHIGFAGKTIAVKNDNYITVKLSVVEQSLADVVISTGMFKRKKESFTGATATFTGDQLRVVGNRNIITSLKTMDPSFIVLENNRLGSNPNALPTIELRGKTSINTNTTTTSELNSQYASDPNLPLFVLNGFPTSLQIINNLDMNRVASVTILKDAASTAIWGSKAANGVVVIETKRPIAGELRVNYTADLIADLPDLTSYDMMNSAEKLEFERLAGLYAPDNFLTPITGDYLYNQRLEAVTAGVNSYWLSEPVRNAFSNKHSLQLTGGNNDLNFGAGISYGDQQGVMKGSGRKNWGGNVDISYRKGKLNVTNQLYVTGYKANESPYGSFADFVSMNPFFRKTAEDGFIPRYADESTDNGSYAIANPLYNASLFGINRTENLDIINNIQGIYSITPDFRVSGGLQITNGNTSTTVFVSPENTSFDAKVPIEKGNYTRLEQRQKGYNGNITLTYAKILGLDHSLNLNFRSDIAENALRTTGFKAVGFPEGTNGNPAFAYEYDPYSRPSSSSTVVRSYSGTGLFSYAYKMRYLVDLVYTLNGSNAFGSDNKTQPSWSVGLGWNMHKEALLSQYSWLNLLKLRANIGVSGNENLGTFTSNSVYTALTGSNVFGQSLDMSVLGTPGLQWQNTRSLSTGIEFAVLNNRISGIINYYEKTTNPLIVGTTGVLPSSVGLQFDYPVNVGKMTYKGWEANLRVSPVYDVKERVVWTVTLTGSKVTGRYSEFGKSMDASNKEQTQTGGLIRFMDGYSPDDLWAVRSKGIDPSTGKEIFTKKDASETFTYSADDIVRIGNSRPKIEGVIGSTFNYKGLYVNVALRYRLAGYLMNTALYDKVENISYQGLKLNQDKRALYNRWQKPGDITSFKGISIYDYTPMSSRFLQEDSHLIGESFSLGWDFLADSWIRKLKMQGLRIYAYTSDIFRLTSVKTERGIEYPFARSVSVGINASF